MIKVEINDIFYLVYSKDFIQITKKIKDSLGFKFIDQKYKIDHTIFSTSIKELDIQIKAGAIIKVDSLAKQTIKLLYGD